MSPVAVIVGAPGAGKTTIGRALATKLNVAFRDTDADVEAQTGKTVTDIFVEVGEPEFRRLEVNAVKAALAEHDGVLALGGGAVLAEETRALLKSQPVVWLKVDLSSAADRVGLNTSRPLLLGNVRGTLKKLMDDREPLYREVASLVIDTSEKSPTDVVTEIVEALA